METNTFLLLDKVETKDSLLQLIRKNVAIISSLKFNTCLANLELFKSLNSAYYFSHTLKPYLTQSAFSG